MPEPRRRPVQHGTARWRAGAALFDSVAPQLGDRRDSRSRPALEVARVRGVRFRPVPAAQRNAGGAELAVLGVERDGHRPGVHRRGRRRRVRGRGGEALGAKDRAALARVRAASRVDYSVVRSLKARALRRAFAWFADNLWGTGDRRDRSLRAFEERERWWLDDFGLFRALHDEHGGRHWRDWEPGLRDRDPSALAAARERLEWQITYHAYLQWVADEQWQRARMESAPVGVFGDFPFMVSGHSADVWARQHEFDLDSSVGTPPDAFSATGQDWGLPVYRWDVVAASDYAWLARSDAQMRRSCTTAFASIT